MMLNLRTIYHASEERTKFAVLGLVLLLLVGLCGVVFLSPTLTLALVAALVVVFVSFIRPTWTLAMLMVYLPFEPFLLKWVPDDVYVYARYSSELLVYLLCGVVVWRLVSGVQVWRKTPVDVPFIVFSLLLLATTLMNFESVTISVLGLRQVVRFMLLYFVTVQIAPSKAWLYGVVKALLVVLGIQITLGLSQAVIGERLDTFLLPSDRKTIGEIQLTPGTTQFWDPGQRVFGTMGRYDQLGTFMAMLMLLMVAWMYEKQETRNKKQDFFTTIKSFATSRFGLLLLLAVPTLVLTYSRSAWFGFVLGFLFIAVWMKRDRRVMAGVAAGAVAVTAYLAFSGLAVGQLVDTGNQSVGERFFEAFSAERWSGEYYGLGRMFWIVHTVITIVPDAPLFGHGPASYGGGAVAALKNTRVYEELGLPFGVYGTDGYIDNNWFSLWGEAGTLGLAAFLWMYLVLFVLCMRLGTRARDHQVRAFALGVGAAMIALALNAFLATYLEVRTLAPYIWIFAGMVTVLSEQEAEQTS